MTALNWIIFWLDINLLVVLYLTKKGPYYG